MAGLGLLELGRELFGREPPLLLLPSFLFINAVFNFVPFNHFGLRWLQRYVFQWLMVLIKMLWFDFSPGCNENPRRDCNGKREQGLAIALTFRS
jgi:hypothetical protein